MELHSEKIKDVHSLNSTFVNLGFDKEMVSYLVMNVQKLKKRLLSLIGLILRNLTLI